jgi:hypothetical protein
MPKNSFVLKANCIRHDKTLCTRVELKHYIATAICETNRKIHTYMFQNNVVTGLQWFGQWSREGLGCNFSNLTFRAQVVTYHV